MDMLKPDVASSKEKQFIYIKWITSHISNQTLFQETYHLLQRLALLDVLVKSSTPKNKSFLNLDFLYTFLYDSKIF
jgi:hypothetical protein